MLLTVQSLEKRSLHGAERRRKCIDEGEEEEVMHYVFFCFSLFGHFNYVATNSGAFWEIQLKAAMTVVSPSAAKRSQKQKKR